MNSRERVLKTLSGEPVDITPIDLGTTNCTTMTKKAYEALQNKLGIKKEIHIMQENFQVVFIDEEILDILKIDTRGIHPKPTYQKTVIDKKSYLNQFGTKLKMAETGLYYDMVEFPMAGKSFSEIKEFNWPDPKLSMNLDGVREKARKLKEKNEYFLVADAIDVGLFENCWFIRGFEDFLMDLIINPDIANYLLENVLKYELGRYELFLKVVGEFVDMVFVGDDMAGLDNTFMRIDTYRNIIKPYHKEFFKKLKQLAKNAKLMFHCCGAVSDLIPDLVEIGVDVLNPIQTSAKGMQVELLRDKYGKDICFWGGIDSIKILPRGSEEEVRQEVRRVVDVLGQVGYVLTAVHDIQPDVPPENVLAMYDEGRKIERRFYGKRK